MNTERKPQQKKKEKRPPRKITKSYLQNSGVYYLERYPASIAHFQTVMRRKIDRSLQHHGVPEREACLNWLGEVTEKFVEYGYLNDQRYAEGMVNSLLQKGRAQMKIRARLKQAGLDEQTIAAAMSKLNASRAEHIDINDLPSNWPQNPSNINEYIAALKCAKKRRIGPYTALARTPKEPEKALAILARNGFSYDLAQTILRTDADEAERLLQAIV